MDCLTTTVGSLRCHATANQSESTTLHVIHTFWYISTRQFTVSYLFARSSGSSAYRYRRVILVLYVPSGPRGFYGGSRKGAEKNRPTVPRPLSRFATHPRWPPFPTIPSTTWQPVCTRKKWLVRSLSQRG